MSEHEKLTIRTETIETWTLQRRMKRNIAVVENAEWDEEVGDLLKVRTPDLEADYEKDPMLDSRAGNSTRRAK